MKTILLFGATGSLGTACLDVIRAHPDRFSVRLMTCNTQEDSLRALADEFKPQQALTVIHDGDAALCEAASEPADLVVMAITGMAALKPTLAAIRAGQTIAFASKEALVAAGSFMIEEAKRCGATLLPLDSEHNAIFQCWQGRDVERIVLTASGGPFLHMDRGGLAAITPAQAMDHPTWSMGAKISVDSATMMNKGLEIIEAHHLFGLPPNRIDTLIHPQSIVHGMIEYADGSVLCQMGPPDMRTAMTHVMFYPERGATPGRRLDLSALQNLSFIPPDPMQFPALALARQAMEAGQGACVVLNTANEMAVDAFLQGRIGFLDITDSVDAALDRYGNQTVTTLDDVFELDALLRREGEDFIRQAVA